MNNSVSRIIFVAISVPLLLFLAIKVSFLHYLPLVLIELFFIAGSALELHKMIEKDSNKIRKLEVLIISLLPSLAVYFSLYINKLNSLPILARWFIPVSIVAIGSFLASSLPIAFSSSQEKITLSVKKSALNSFYIFYPGILGSAITSLLCYGENSGLFLVWFMVIVFSNDSFAWLAGVTLGRKRNIFHVSPKKSLEGFIAGMVASIISAFSGILFIPGAAEKDFWLLLIFGILCGISVVSGDLFESALKRACNIKDSGNIIPGRGGILDCFDSILFTAPVFSICIHFIFNF